MGGTTSSRTVWATEELYKGWLCGWRDGSAMQTLGSEFRSSAPTKKAGIVGCICNPRAVCVETDPQNPLASYSSQLVSSGFSEGPSLETYGGGTSKMVQWVKALATRTNGLNLTP